MGELSKLKGLGPKSEKHLNDIGIYTRKDLAELGPVNAYLKLKDAGKFRPSMNFLYAMVGALEGVSWTEIARSEKYRLLMEIDGVGRLQDAFRMLDTDET